MKLSVVIICWNDLRVIRDCLRSIYEGTHATDFEVIISDNGSVDDSIEFVRKHYPQVRIVENQQNLGFARGNNAGIRASRGEYVLILNPDTIIHDGAFDRLIEFADRHPEAGAFGCRVLNPDGTYQVSARLFPTIWRYWVSALGLSKLSSLFVYEEYPRWRGDTERSVDWQSGCCVMFRAGLLKNLGGFDEQFFYHFEEVDLCRRVWNAGRPILFTPQAVITHLGGQSVGRLSVSRSRNIVAVIVTSTSTSAPARRGVAGVSRSPRFECVSLVTACSTNSSRKKRLNVGWICTAKSSDGTRLSTPWTSSNAGKSLA
jgi:GT2 family glycosyltransferase